MNIFKFEKAFKKTHSFRLSSDSVPSLFLLEDLFLALGFMVGYASTENDGSKTAKFILVHETRHIPYLMLRRTQNSLPLIHFEFRSKSVFIKVLGPLNEVRVCPFIEVQIDFEKSADHISDSQAEASANLVVGGVAIGVHTWEEHLRTPAVEVHLGERVQENCFAGNVEHLFAENCRRSFLFDWLVENTPSAVLYVGHDCYRQAIDVNIGLNKNIPVLLLPKGKPNHLYTAEDSPGSWSPDRKVFYSHLHRWLTAQIQLRWDSVSTSYLEEASVSIQERLKNLSTLSYMRIDSESRHGYESFKNATDLQEYNPDLVADSGVPLVFAFHSFSDEACIWGMDQVNSLYSLFLNAARLIINKNPEDMVVLRPHPNYYRLFSEELAEQIESGKLSGLKTTHFDIYLQLRLCRDIKKLGGQIRLSGPSSPELVLKNRKTVVLTRNGNIVIEAAWLRRPCVFSVLAPYAVLFGNECQFSTAEELSAALQHARERALQEDSMLPSHEELARYVAILETPRGLKKGRKGGLAGPISSVAVLRNFDDFAYPGQTVSETLDGILDCYDSGEEKSLFRKVSGI